MARQVARVLCRAASGDRSRRSRGTASPSTCPRLTRAVAQELTSSSPSRWPLWRRDCRFQSCPCRSFSTRPTPLPARRSRAGPTSLRPPLQRPARLWRGPATSLSSCHPVGRSTRRRSAGIRSCFIQWASSPRTGWAGRAAAARLSLALERRSGRGQAPTMGRRGRSRATGLLSASLHKRRHAARRRRRQAAGRAHRVRRRPRQPA